MKPFRAGLRSVIPIIPGIIPFGAVMGSAFFEAKLNFTQAMFMNTTVFAGAAQLATVDLMKLKAATVVVVITGLIINLRFILYSAALSPYLREASPVVKFLCAFTLTDQSYAAMTGNPEKYETNAEATQFYLGTATSMYVSWCGSVIAGYVFGNFAPKALSLDYAIPLSFMALLIPTLKSKAHYLIAALSSVLSLVFYNLPLKTGLMATALVSILVAWMLIKRRRP